MWASNSRIRGWPIILDDWDFYILKIINFWAGSGYVYAPTATEPLWNTVFN
ncbi:MAG TPA: hypothetical protein PKX05_03300 [bacterium]|nr:hypothetical protein [bacterium]